MMRKFLITLLMLPMAFSVYAQRQVVNLNHGWQFTPGWEVKPGVYTEVSLPHTWNTDALAGKPDYYRGIGSYFKIMNIPAAWKSQKVFIRFHGANSVTDLYVNGKHVGQHKGGYTAFSWDISSHLNFGGRNTIWVRVNNAIDLDLMPLVGDFNTYGGLYRGVEFVVTPKTHLSLGDFGSDGVYVNTSRISSERAEVNVSAIVEGTPGDVAEVRFRLRDGAQATVDSLIRRIKISENGKADVAALFSVHNPRMWNSVKDPYLYHADVIVSSMLNRSGTTPSSNTDSIGQHFGIRTFSVDEDNNFILNGNPFQIKGVARHEDWAELGSAVHAENHLRDIELMTEMGVNAVRLAGYPHDPYFISLCDRAGIIVWSELPFNGPGGNRDTGFNNSEAFRENGKKQLREMIHQMYNHPSIFFWGLYNDLTQRGDDPLEYLKELSSIAKNEDPSRLTIAASTQDGDLNFVTDLIGFNQFLGWTSGLPTDFSSWGMQLRRNWPKLPSGVSAYGAGASIYQHADSLQKPQVQGSWHPEQWQAHFHEVYWKNIVSKNYFWGTFVWTMFDYGSASRTEGPRHGMNDCGLVTFDRRVPKDAFYFYKANWNEDDPFVYIAQRRWRERGSQTQDIKVYSNDKEVDLSINGVSVGRQPNDGYGTFQWKGVKLKPGENTLEAVNTLGAADRTRIFVR